MAARNQLEIITPTGDISFYDLASPQGVLTLGRHPDNLVILDGAGVAPFQALLDHRQEPYRLVPLEPPGPAVELRCHEAVGLAGYTLVLIEGGAKDLAPSLRDAPLPLGRPQGEQSEGPGVRSNPALARAGRRAAPARKPGGGLDPGLVLLAVLVLVLLAMIALLVFSLRPAVPESGPAADTGLPARPEEDTGLLAAMLARLRQAKAVYARKPPPTPAIPPPVMSYDAMFQEIGELYGLDWRLLAATAYQESALNPVAIGRDSDMGLMQILPTTWNEWAPQVNASDPYDPYSNIMVGAAYMAYLREYCRARGYPQEQWFLAAYNWGPDNVSRVFANGGDWQQVPDKVRGYARNILQAAQYPPPVE